MQEKGLEVMGDPESLRPILRQVLGANSELVHRFQNGDTKLLGFFVGQVMRVTQGKADPGVVNRLLRDELGK